MTVHELHASPFAKSALLSSSQMPGIILPLDVIRALNKARISFVLVGAYGLAGWRHESRATEDVDIVVAARQIKKAVAVLTERFPDLEAIDLPVVVRLRQRETLDVLIDVMKPLQQPYLELFKNTHTVRSEGERYRVPSLEMAIVMKFAAMTSLYRAVEDKYQDAHDFIRIVKSNPGLDHGKVARLASKIYSEAGKDVLDLIRKAQAGETLPL